jgi:hypothetical protein
MNTSEESKHTVMPVRLLAAAALTSAAMENVEAGASTPCDQPADVFIETGSQLIGHGEFITIDLAGASGGAQFTFASGTVQADIISAINDVVQSTGVTAACSEANPARIQLESVVAGDNAFVSAQQMSGIDPLIHLDAKRGEPLWRFIAHGDAGLAGDANCDGGVGVPDLLSVINHWGACDVQPPDCTGDLNLNGVVNVQDLLMVINNWGATS